MTVPRRHDFGLLVGWKQLELAGQYFLASAAAIVFICMGSGWLINTAISHQESSQRARETGLFLSGVFSTLLEGLAASGALSPAEIERLDSLMADPHFAAAFPYLEVWLPDGSIAYSNSSMLMGRQFELPEQARKAFDGEVISSFSDLEAEEHTMRQFSVGLLEVYAPVRRLGRNEIFAVVEIHEGESSLGLRLQQTTFMVWLFVVSGAILAIVSLSGIVLKAGRTLKTQRSDLDEKRSFAVALQEQVGNSQHAAGIAEKRLTLASADLHDGPSQLIAFAMIKAHEADVARSPTNRAKALADIATALIAAQSEIRSIMQGLALPEIADLTLDAIIDDCVSAHTRRTGAQVVRVGYLECPSAGLETRVALYRVVQEGLANAFRHSEDPSVTVFSSRQDDLIRVRLVNAVILPKSRQKHEISGMGLDGVKARVDLLGGSVTTSIIANQFCLDLKLNVSHQDD